MKAFEFMIIYQPSEESREKGEKAAILVERQTVLAASEREVTLKAAKLIPDAYADKLDELEVAVRPF